MSCSNVYWFETFRLPGLGPLGGMGSSAAGGGLGLRCVVDDLGPVGAIFDEYEPPVRLWSQHGRLGKCCCPQRRLRKSTESANSRGRGPSTVGSLAGGVPELTKSGWLSRESNREELQRTCSWQARSVRGTVVRSSLRWRCRRYDFLPLSALGFKAKEINRGWSRVGATGVCWSYRLIQKQVVRQPGDNASATFHMREGRAQAF